MILVNYSSNARQANIIPFKVLTRYLSAIKAFAVSLQHKGFEFFWTHLPTAFLLVYTNLWDLVIC